MVATTCDYAKRDVLTSLLSLVRRLHFIQSYAVTTTERGKNRRVKDEIPQQHGSRRSQGHNTLVKGRFCCTRYLHATIKPKSCDPWAREVTLSYVLKHLSRT